MNQLTNQRRNVGGGSHPVDIMSVSFSALVSLRTIYYCVNWVPS